MAFDPAFLDELRMRVALADVVGRRVKLVKKGREYSGLCPFHNEKTPSFTVNEDKGFFHCFGCGAHGDVLGFVMRTENLTFPEAIEKLAEEVGLPLPAQTRENRAQTQVRQTLHSVLDAAAHWFAQELEGPRGRTGKEYLRRRGITDECIARFRIGFAPEIRGALKTALLKQGFTEQQLLDVGLLRRREERGDTYDLFRNRIIFPISDRRGRVIAFGGRVLDPAPEGAPKYLNSPETGLFHKGRTLYGLSHALPLARETGRLVVTEGYLDTISLLQVGIPAVAPLGTAITEEQLEMLWRVVPEPTLCFDGDKAGQRALERASLRALPILRSGFSLYFAKMPLGEDPDSLVRNRGVQAFEEVLKCAKPLSETLWDLSRTTHSLDTPEHIAALEKELISRSNEIADRTAQTTFLRFFKNKIWEATRIRRDTPKFVPKGARPDPGYLEVEFRVRLKLAALDPLGVGTAGTTERREAAIVATVVNHPEVLDEHIDAFAHLKLFTPEYDALRGHILGIYGREPLMSEALMKHELGQRGFGQTLNTFLGSDSRVIEWFVRPTAPLEDAEKGFLDSLKIQQRFASLPEVEEAMQEFANNPNERNWARLRALQDEVNAPTSSEEDIMNFGLNVLKLQKH